MCGTKLTIIIAEDNALFRDALRETLERDQGLVVVGEATDGAEAVTLACALEPDVVVMDLELPVLSGFEATRLIAAHRTATRVVAMSMHDDEAVKTGAIRAGATEFVVKDAAEQALVEAVRRAAARHD